MINLNWLSNSLNYLNNLKHVFLLNNIWFIVDWYIKIHGPWGPIPGAFNRRTFNVY